MVPRRVLPVSAMLVGLVVGATAVAAYQAAIAPLGWAAHLECLEAESGAATADDAPELLALPAFQMPPLAPSDRVAVVSRVAERVPPAWSLLAQHTALLS